MARTIGAVITAMASAIGIEKMLGVNHTDAVCLRQAIRSVGLSGAKLIVDFYAGTPIAVARKLPNLIDEVVIERFVGSRIIKG